MSTNIEDHDLDTRLSIALKIRESKENNIDIDLGRFGKVAITNQRFDLDQYGWSIVHHTRCSLHAKESVCAVERRDEFRSNLVHDGNRKGNAHGTIRAQLPLPFEPFRDLGTDAVIHDKCGHSYIIKSSRKSTQAIKTVLIRLRAWCATALYAAPTNVLPHPVWPSGQCCDQ